MKNLGDFVECLFFFSTYASKVQFLMKTKIAHAHIVKARLYALATQYTIGSLFPYSFITLFPTHLISSMHIWLKVLIRR